MGENNNPTTGHREQNEPSSRTARQAKHRAGVKTMNMMRVNATVARNAAVALPARRNLAARGVRATRKATVMSSKLSNQEKVQAAFLVSAAGALVNTPAAEAATISPSLNNLLNSVVAGGVILGVIATALAAISRFDKTERR